MTVYPNLERLNVLLRDPKLELPPFRSKVDPSCRNLKWLKKVLPGSPKCGTELRGLLDLPGPELLKAVNNS